MGVGNANNAFNQLHDSSQTKTIGVQDEAHLVSIDGGRDITSSNTNISTVTDGGAFAFSADAIKEALSFSRQVADHSAETADKVMNLFGTFQKENEQTTREAVKVAKDAIVSQVPAGATPAERLPAWVPWAVGGVVLVVIIQGRK